MTLGIGSHVIFIDDMRREHDALVETVHDSTDTPCINLIRIASENGNDNYGAQKKHETSVVHKSNNSAEANCWKRPNE